MAEQSAPQRGALQVAIIPATPTLAAGSNFSIAVNITNPFDVPITIGGVSTQLPVDLYDVALAAHRAEQVRAQDQMEATRNNLLRQLGSQTVPRAQWQEGALRPVLKMAAHLIPSLGWVADDFADMASTAIAQASEVNCGRPSWNQLANTAARLVEKPKPIVGETLTEEQIQAKVDEIMQSIQEEYQQLWEREVKQLIALQPGDSTTRVFTLRTKKGLRFSPASYNLNILLSYEADSATHTQTIPYTLDIQASLTSMIIGALLGSFFGVLASDPNVPEWQFSVWLPKMLSALVLSGFAVIAFARKKGVQPMIAVQDFWGGMLVGFLVGYTGTQAVGDVFGTGNTAGG